jgi:hypothetical protein
MSLNGSNDGIEYIRDRAVRLLEFASSNTYGHELCNEYCSLVDQFIASGGSYDDIIVKSGDAIFGYYLNTPYDEFDYIDIGYGMLVLDVNTCDDDSMSSSDCVITCVNGKQYRVADTCVVGTYPAQTEPREHLSRFSTPGAFREV